MSASSVKQVAWSLAYIMEKYAQVREAAGEHLTGRCPECGTATTPGRTMRLTPQDAQQPFRLIGCQHCPVCYIWWVCGCETCRIWNWLTS